MHDRNDSRALVAGLPAVTPVQKKQGIPAKRNRTAGLPARPADSVPSVQRKSATAAAPAGGAVEDWTPSTVRPDLYSQPIIRQSLGEVGSLSTPVTAGTQRPSAMAKCVDGGGGTRIGLAVENDPQNSGKGDGSVQKAEGKDAEKQPVAKKKKAGVDSFTVNWSKNANASPTNARLRLDYKAKFKKDDEHDPALAEFRQNVMTVWKITDGTHKGQEGDTSPMHDDNYSRADDTDGNTINDVDFVSNDNPGIPGVAADDVLDYAFTAEQMIIDTSDNDKVIAKEGPHTGTIKGKAPRTYKP